jgi:hypothetical protein
VEYGARPLAFSQINPNRLPADVSLTQITPTAAPDASNYPAQKWVAALSRTGAPLFSLFLQEFISGRHRLPRRNPGVSALRQSKEQRRNSAPSRC